MMVQKSKSSSSAEQSSKKTLFVNYDLTRSDKDALKKASPSSDELWLQVTQLVQQGYKVTFGWDNYAECFACWLIGVSPESKNEGLILPSRASSAVKAFAACLYKHVTVFEGVWRDRVLSGKPDDDF